MKLKITLLTSTILLIANLALPTYSFAQVAQQWVSSYWHGIDSAAALAVDGLGNVYVTGVSSDSQTGNDFATVKYNASGVQQWVKRYDGGAYGPDQATSIAVDGSGNVYITGISDAINYDYATIKYNSMGIQQWVARYNGAANDNDFAFALAVDGSGNVFVTGRCLNLQYNTDIVTIKYNSLGVQQWVRIYDAPVFASMDEARAIAVDGSGNVYVAGGSYGSTTGVDYTTIKYNSSGVQQWIRFYDGGSGDDFPWSLALDVAGNVYVTGESRGSGTNNDYATIKYNSSGVQQWAETYNGPGNYIDVARSVAVDGSGNVFVTGKSIGTGTDYDYATIKYDSTGVQQWASRYNGPGNGSDAASKLSADGWGNVYVTGQSLGSGTARDYATIKYDAMGGVQWVKRYDSPNSFNDAASSIAVDGSGNVYVTGKSLGYVTIKYSQPVSVETMFSESSLSQLFPNPASNQFTIALKNNNKKVDVTIADITGKIIYSTTANETQKIEVNTQDIAAGIYVVQIQTADFIASKKLVIEK